MVTNDSHPPQPAPDRGGGHSCRPVSAEILARQIAEALREQVAECFDETCEMCTRHEALLARFDHLTGEAA